MPRKSSTRIESDIDDDDVTSQISCEESDEDMEIELLKNTAQQLKKGSIFIFHGGKTMINYMKPIAQDTFRATSMYLVWIVLHYMAGQLYSYYCAPSMFGGFFVSPFLVSAPHCKGLRWALYNGGNVIDSMWIVLATWLCSKIVVSL